MALYITPTNELNAVNEILTALGAVPVNTLVDISKLADASIALDTLRNVAREVQSKGWWFNKSYDVPLTPSGGEIAIGDDILALRPSAGTLSVAGETANWVLRKNKLYNLATNSFTFGQSTRADITYLLDFEELPESARRFVTIRAAKITQTKILGADSLHVFNEAQEADAWKILEGDEITMNPNSSLYMQRARVKFQSLQVDPTTRVTSNQQRGNYDAG